MTRKPLRRIDDVQREANASKAEAFKQDVALMVKTHTKFKSVMLKRGLRLAKAKCPKGCEGKFIHGSLNGQRNHLHWHCDCGKIGMIE